MTISQAVCFRSWPLYNIVFSAKLCLLYIDNALVDIDNVLVYIDNGFVYRDTQSKRNSFALRQRIVLNVM